MTAASRRAAARAIAAEARYASRTAAPPPRIGDFGAEHRLRQQRVVIVDVADLNDPQRTIRRATVADPILRMYKRGELRMDHWGAAGALRDLAESSWEGSRSAMASLGEARAPWSNFLPPPTKRGRATIAFERALRLTWPYAHVVAWVVLDNRTLDAFAKARNIRREDASLWLRMGLDLLSDHFAGVTSSQDS